MKLITTEAATRPEVLRWHERIRERYLPPETAKLTVVLPCSAKKPYSKSKSHMKFMEHIRRGAGQKIALVHEVILTSPLGLVPRELESVYPAAHYDVPVTGVWSSEEKKIAVELLSDYMKKTEAKAIGYVEGAYREICEELDIPVAESLRELEEKISKHLEKFETVRKDKLERIRKICDFQFGSGAGKILIPPKANLRGMQIFIENKQVAAINPWSGFLVLSLLGGKMLKRYGKHLVEISFKPKTNSIFCAGVEKAGREIRPGDEVIAVYKNGVVGVGRAALNGEEMERAEKGLAVSLRHKRALNP